MKINTKKSGIRILAILMALIMCLGMMSVMAYADDETQTEGPSDNNPTVSEQTNNESDGNNDNNDNNGTTETNNDATETNESNGGEGGTTETTDPAEDPAPNGDSAGESGSGSGSSNEDSDEPSIKISKTSLNLALNGTTSASLTARPVNIASPQLVWASDDESVATVSAGNVNAVGVGTTNIVVFNDTEPYVEAICTVTVHDIQQVNTNAVEGGTSTGFVAGASSETIEDIDTPLAEGDGSPVISFTDVAEGSWAAKAIGYVVSKGLFNGTSATTFNPAGNATREQVMTVLARYAGNSGATIEEGVSWAIANGVSDGSNPKGFITREQFVTMLWRLASEPAGENALDFADATSVDDWAAPAMRWAVDAGVVTGYSNGNLGPLDVITRAQMATIIQRCDEMGLVMA